MIYTIRPVHIDLIRVGDVVEYNGKLRTVGKDAVECWQSRGWSYITESGIR